MNLANEEVGKLFNLAQFSALEIIHRTTLSNSWQCMMAPVGEDGHPSRENVG
jgi:hypothetical protein